MSEVKNPEFMNLPLVLAIHELAPNAQWNMIGNDLENLEWNDQTISRPSDETIIAKAQEIKSQVPMTRLRRERDARLKEVDWVTLRAMRTETAIPQVWKDYMQALADITDTHPNPVIADGELININWPTRPDGEPAGLRRLRGL